MAWLGKEGGLVVLRSPPGGGQVLVTAYGDDAPSMLGRIAVRPLERSSTGSRQERRAPRPADRGTGTKPGLAITDDTEVVVRVELEGDRSFQGSGWAGVVGSGLHIEAFSVLPKGDLTQHDIEYKAIGADGRETRWMSDAQLCGARGRGLSLTGFAVRLSSGFEDHYDVLYRGAFAGSGTTDWVRNGEQCVSMRRGEPLEAIMVRIAPRHGE